MELVLLYLSSFMFICLVSSSKGTVNPVERFFSREFKEDLFKQVTETVFVNDLTGFVTREEWKDLLSKGKESVIKARSSTEFRCSNLLKDIDCRYLKRNGACINKRSQMMSVCAKECQFCGQITHCSQLPFGCCRDQTTPAKGPDFEGCPEACVDKRGKRFCKVVRRLSFCFSTHGQFLHTCTFSCGFCRSCEDNLPLKCYQARRFGLCQKLKPLMMNECRKSCNYCGENDICFKYRGCPEGSSCYVHEDGDPYCKCRRKCHAGDHYTGQVCGRDNRVYKSLCQLKQSICGQHQHLTVKNYGPCNKGGASTRASNPPRCKGKKDKPGCAFQKNHKAIFCRSIYRAKVCPVMCNLCNAAKTAPVCSFSKYGCCLNGISVCEGPGYEGCPDKEENCKDVSKVLCRKFVALCGHENHLYFMRRYCPVTCHLC